MNNIKIAVLALLAVLVISGCAQNSTEPVNNYTNKTLETTEQEQKSVGTTITVAGGRSLKEWETLIREKLSEEYAITEQDSVRFDYTSVETSPMGNHTFTVTSGDQIFSVEVPGEDGFIFDKNGSIIKSGDSPTDDDLKSNISISPPNDEQ